MGSETCGCASRDQSFSSFKCIKQLILLIFIVHINNFQLLQIIGVGNYGRVWKAIYKKNKQIYAIKEMSKDLIDQLEQRKVIENERQFLEEITSNFIVKLQFAFQDKDNLYLVFNYLNGGDLNYHLFQGECFSEEQATCVILGLNDLHTKQIIHCNIKPENIILDNDGYAYIADFGVAKQKGDKCTPQELNNNFSYIAPEVFLKEEALTFAVDYFSIGVLLHELLFNEAPNQGSTVKELKEFFLSQELTVNDDDSQEITEECVNFMNELFVKKSKVRLGYRGGLNELKNHSWFNGFNWEELEKREMKALFIPSSSKDNFNSSLYKKKYMNQMKQIQTLTKNSKNTVATQYYKKYTFVRHNDNTKNKQKISEDNYENVNTSKTKKRNNKTKKLRLLKQNSSPTLGVEELSSSRSNEFPQEIDNVDAYLPSNIKRNSIIMNSPKQFMPRHNSISQSNINSNPIVLDNYINFNRKHIKRNETTLPKIISPKISTGLPSIKEESLFDKPKNEFYPLSKSKFFQYNAEDHLDNQENIVSPFIYAADQIQGNVRRHKLDKHKTVRMNENHNRRSSIDRSESDFNSKINNEQTNLESRRNSRPTRNSLIKGDIKIRNNRRKSFFDFTSSVN